MKILDKAAEFSQAVSCEFEKSADCTTIACIEQADGRKAENPLSAKGSYVYAAYGSDGSLLYVGETGKSIKRRFISDAGGSHKSNVKNWYDDVTYVKYLKLDPDSEKYRILLEKALIFAGNPKFNE